MGPRKPSNYSERWHILIPRAEFEPIIQIIPMTHGSGIISVPIIRIWWSSYRLMVLISWRSCWRWLFAIQCRVTERRNVCTKVHKHFFLAEGQWNDMYINVHTCQRAAVQAAPGCFDVYRQFHWHPKVLRYNSCTLYFILPENAVRVYSEAVDGKAGLSSLLPACRWFINSFLVASEYNSTIKM
jgi:hypothetical protein